MSDDKAQIEKLKRIAQTGDASNWTAQMAAVDALLAYGASAIPALIEVGERSNSSVTKRHALEAVAKLKSSSPKTFTKAIKDLE